MNNVLTGSKISSVLKSPRDYKPVKVKRVNNFSPQLSYKNKNEESEVILMCSAIHSCQNTLNCGPLTW